MNVIIQELIVKFYLLLSLRFPYTKYIRKYEEDIQSLEEYTASLTPLYISDIE